VKHIGLYVRAVLHQRVKIWIASPAYLADDSVNIESVLNMIAVSFRDDWKEHIDSLTQGANVRTDVDVCNLALSVFTEWSKKTTRQKAMAHTISVLALLTKIYETRSS
jgi:hypothetical protein